MSRSAGSSLKIEGSADALEQLKLGSIRSEAGLAITGEVGYKTVGVKGPLLLEIVRVRRFFKDPKRQGQGLQEPFERVTADLREPDDE
jgi:hypothetical protein